MNYPSLLNVFLVILTPLGGSGLNEIFSEVLKFLQTNENIISDLAAVVVIIPALIRLSQAISERRRKNKKKPIEITVEIDGKSISISADDLERAEELLNQFQKLHPEVAQNAKSDSKAKIRATVPKRRKKKKTV